MCANPFSVHLCVSDRDKCTEFTWGDRRANYWQNANKGGLICAWLCRWDVTA